MHNFCPWAYSIISGIMCYNNYSRGCIHHIYPWIFTTGDNRNNKNRTGTRSLSFLFCFCIFILIVITGLSLQFFSTGILNAIELHRPELLGSYRDMVRSSFSLNNGIFRVTTVMLLAPVCEELVFRGISLSSPDVHLHADIQMPSPSYCQRCCSPFITAI